MALSFPKHQLAGVMPHTVSAAAKRAGRHHAGPIGRVFARLRDLGSRRATINELNGFSERELADIGLSRSDIHRVFDPGFARDYAQRG
jgi:uncharacterized protein YjiS (DUF1127 family)